MSRYRQTMSEALKQVYANEDSSYLMPKLNPTQIMNIKKTWSMKTAKDVTPAVKDMIKKMDIPTQLAIKQANINQLSKLIEEEYLPEFNDAMIQTLKKEYEPMRGKTISVTNANKLGALFTRFDSNKNALEKLYGADIPFISTMAMTRLMTKHGYKADKLNKIRKEELDLLEEAELLGEGKGTIKGFRDNKEKSNMVSLAKQHGLKVKDVSGGIELSGNMRKILDMQLAAQGNGLKAEEVAEGRMSDIDAMRKAGATAAEIAKELKLPVSAVKAILGEELKEEEGEEEKLKKEVEKKNDEIALLKQKQQQDKAKATQSATQKMVNPETGEPLLQVGIAYKHLKAKLDKEKEEKKAKENSQKIADLASDKKDLEESNASDKAKAMGLDYMKFGRYGKDGKVTHKTSGDNLVKVGKDDEPTGDKPAKKPDAPKKDTGKDKESDTKIKSRNFLKDLEDGKLETKDGDPIELDFDQEDFWDDAVEKAREMGLPDLADELDGVGGSVMEMEPDEAQAEYQDIIAKYAGKPVKSLEFAKKADEAIDIFTDSANADLNYGVKRGNELIAQNFKGMAKDLGNTFKIIQKMVDSDTTEGNPGSGMSNSMKGFRPEVIETIKSMESISDKLEEIKDEIDDEKTNDILTQIQGEIEFCTDENADHDGYTKSHKVNSSIESISQLINSLGKRSKELNKNIPSTPKVPSQNEMQKDLEDMVTDGMIDVEVDGDTISMSKEYEPSQEREAEKDAQAIRDYLRKKGIKVTKSDVEVEKDDEYIQINVNKNINEEMAKDKAYAIGMATAKKKYNDEPPLEKKTIKKGHEIADKLMGMKKEETIKEFKKMTVTIADPMKRTKAMKDIEGQGFKIQRLGSRDFKVDGKGADLNKYATDLKNFYGATVKAEGTMIGGIVTDNSGKKMPGYDKAKKALKDFMSKPQPAKGASDKVMSFIFDDELLDDLYSAEKKNMSDVRPMVKKRLKALGIKENAPTLSDLERMKKQGMKPKKEDVKEEVTAVYTDKKTRQVKSKKFKDINTAKDHFRKTGEAAGQITYKEEVDMEHPAKSVYEQIAGLKKKAEKSGMPYSILKKVYDRGMAAWRGGHRPGTTQQQWAFARVNSFVTKSSGTWGGADKDLAKQVKGK